MDFGYVYDLNKKWNEELKAPAIKRNSGSLLSIFSTKDLKLFFLLPEIIGNTMLLIKI